MVKPRVLHEQRLFQQLLRRRYETKFSCVLAAVEAAFWILVDHLISLMGDPNGWVLGVLQGCAAEVITYFRSRAYILYIPIISWLYFLPDCIAAYTSETNSLGFIAAYLLTSF